LKVWTQKQLIYNNEPRLCLKKVKAPWRAHQLKLTGQREKQNRGLPKIGLQERCPLSKHHPDPSGITDKDNFNPVLHLPLRRISYISGDWQGKWRELRSR